MPENKWLIVFLIYADYRLQGLKNNQKTYRELENVLSDFQECTLNEGVKLVIIFNSLRFIKEGAEGAEDYTYIFEVTPRLKASEKNTFACIEVINNEVQLKAPGKPHTTEKLTMVFKKIADNSSYKSAHIMLNTWDHGSAFGIFKEGELAEQLTAFTENAGIYPITEALFKLKKESESSISDKLQKTNTDEILHYYKRKYFTFKKTPNKNASPSLYEALIASDNRNFSFGDFVHTEQQDYIESNITNSFFHTSHELFNKENSDVNFIAVSGIPHKALIPVEFQFEILTNKELSDAVKDSFGKVNVLVMMNCWMMNLDTLYTMRNTAEYLVAPPSDIDEPGYNYLGIINGIKGNTTSDEAALLPVKTFYNRCYVLNETIKHNLDSTCIITEKTENAVGVQITVEEFAQKILGNDIKNNARLKFYLLFFRKFCYKYDRGGKYFIIDFSHWIKSLGINSDTLANRAPGNDLSEDMYDFIGEISGKIDNLVKGISEKSFFKDSFFKNDTAQSKIRELPTACGIYFPVNNLNTKNPDTQKIIEGSEFLKDSKNWGELLLILIS